MGAGLFRRIRQNHGLEHATIATLIEAGIRPPLGGNATGGGFFVYGRITTETLERAAFLALERLRQGQSDLAVSPYCGTNLVVGAFVAGLVSRLLMGNRRGPRRSFATLVLAILGAALVGRPLGGVIQRRYTTLADVQSLEITGVKCLRAGNFTIHRVSTQVAPRPIP